MNIQAQIINLMIGLQERLGLTYLFIAHDLAVVRHISDRIVVLYLGRVVETAPADELFARPLHPYTASLISAVPIPDATIETTQAPPAERRAAERDRPALRLPLSHPLPDRQGNLRRGTAAAGRVPAWTFCGMSFSGTVLKGELTEGQGHGLSGHKTAQAYRGFAKETSPRASATHKRHAHLPSTGQKTKTF